MARLRGLLGLMDEALNMDAAYEGVKRLGLKADNTAADRATAMGFGDNVYHGTSKDFNEFKDDSSIQGFTPWAKAYFNSPDPEVAGKFGKSIMPLKTRANNIFDYENPEHIKAILRHNPNIIPTNFVPYNGAQPLLSVPEDAIKKGGWYTMESDKMQKGIKELGFDGFNVKEHGTKNTGVYNNTDIRSIFAKFNPKKAGIGAGSVMSADLLANESLSAPERNPALGYMADAYKWTADNGGLLGSLLYGGGAKALEDLSYGTTPMKQNAGRLPSTPTNESLLNLMELFQL